MMKRFHWAFGALLTVGAGGTITAACSSPSAGDPITYPGGDDDDNPTPGTGGNGQIPTGLGVGDECEGSGECRSGLTCENDVCQPAGASSVGEACLIGPECAEGLQCVLGKCAPAGEGASGDACRTDVDCEAGLRCGLVGLSASCVPSGTADLGEDCTTHGDCYSGLYCSGGECSLPKPPLGVPLWEGTECEASSKNGVRAYFEVPGAAGADEGDFFRLPYPNDIRLNEGKPVLDGFPTPGPDLLGVDLVKSYIDRLEADGDHFSGNGSVVFRFSGDVDFDTIEPDDAGTPDTSDDVQHLRFVDLTERNPDGSVDPIKRRGVQWLSGPSRTKYVCQNWVSVRSFLGDVLVPNHTYAVWFTTDVKDAEGNDIERAPHFEAMLKATAPSDPTLAQAYAAYAPLRTYLEEASIDPATLLNAAVFTVGDTVKPMADLKQAIAKQPALSVTNWVKCGGNAKSPCAQAEGGRACGAGTDEYDEYQGLIAMPIFQKGKPPYLESGGDIDTSGPVRTESVCAALSVPKGTAPAAGWPVVVYAHGTGGSFRGHLVPEVAGALATASPKFAVLGIDQVEHGPRRGDSTEEPDNLFFNFMNPDAARGNPLQGAADQLVLRDVAREIGTVTVGSSSFTIDPNHVVFFGHSQGSTHGSLMLPYSEYPGAVLSGNGGSLIHALLTKTNPVNIAGALPIALQDVTFDQDGTPQLAMGEYHPVLSLLQQWIDPADPLNLAPLALKRPPQDGTPKHVFETFGLDDTYSPPDTMKAFVIAAGLDLATPPSGVNPTGDNVLGLDAEDVVSGNFTAAQVDFTGAVRQYAPPSGSDGHFVAFDVPEAQTDVVSFLEALATDGTTPPSVPAP